MSLHTLQSETWRLWCDPNRGSQWVAAEIYCDDQWHAVVPDCRSDMKDRAGQSETAALTAANFHMIPYSNRIRDGRFNFQGKTIQLASAETHAIHGAVRKLPWEVLSSSATSLVTEFKSSDHAQVNWPWPFRALIEQRISSNTLESQITLINQGESAMPAGMGWHPYFVRMVNGSHPTITIPTTGVFPDNGGDCLPVGEPLPLPENLNFNQGRSLNPGQRIDHCMSELNGDVVIHWQDGGIKLTMTASENCAFLVLYNPDMPHFAVEPVTNANDAFNLSDRSIPAGTAVLEPGEKLVAKMSLRAEVSKRKRIIIGKI